jgi:hypothetical protein
MTFHSSLIVVTDQSLNTFLSLLFDIIVIVLFCSRVPLYCTVLYTQHQCMTKPLEVLAAISSETLHESLNRRPPVSHIDELLLLNNGNGTGDASSATGTAAAGTDASAVTSTSSGGFEPLSLTAATHSMAEYRARAFRQGPLSDYIVSGLTSFLVTPQVSQLMNNTFFKSQRPRKLQALLDEKKLQKGLRSNSQSVRYVGKEEEV